MPDLTSLYQKQSLRDIGVQSSINILLDLVDQYPNYFTLGKFTDFFNIIGGTQPPKSYFIDHPKEGYIRFLQIRDFSSESTPTFIPISPKNKICSKNDIVLGRYGASVGKILTGKSGAYNVACAKIEPLTKINNKFLFYWLHNSKFQKQIKSISRSAQGGFNKNDLSKFDVVILKYEYQKIAIEILEKIDKYLIDKKDIKLSLNSLDEFYQIFFARAQIFLNSIHYIESLKNEAIFQQEKIVLLKQSILQEAISGQLTAEWRSHHPIKKGDPNFDAKALLAKIKAEKEVLIAEGKLKKEKPLSEILPDDIPFDLPKSWVWCRLVEIAEGFEYGSSSKSLKTGKVPVLRMGNLQNGLINLKDLVYTNDEKEIEQYLLNYGDLLFNRTNSRELVGKTSLFLCNKKMIYAGYLVRYRMIGVISFQYANYVMNSKLHREWCNLVKSDALGQSNINATKLRSFCFPLPPLAEQKIIVEKVDHIMKIIDQLEEQIKHRQQLAEDLMQTVLQEAFE